MFVRKPVKMAFSDNMKFTEGRQIDFKSGLE